jgi:hypothetical protein
VIAKEKALEVIDGVAEPAGEKAKTARGRLPDKATLDAYASAVAASRCQTHLALGIGGIWSPPLNGNVDDHNRPHDAEDRYHYMHLLA